MPRTRKTKTMVDSVHSENSDSEKKAIARILSGKAPGRSYRTRSSDASGDEDRVPPPQPQEDPKILASDQELASQAELLAACKRSATAKRVRNKCACAKCTTKVFCQVHGGSCVLCPVKKHGKWHATAPCCPRDRSCCECVDPGPGSVDEKNM